MHGIDEVPKAAAKTIELPYHQGITFSQGFESGIKTWPVIQAARAAVLVDIGLDPTVVSPAAIWIT